MILFDYFKKMKNHQYEPEPSETGGKPKKDKTFIGILIVFGVIIAVSFITGVAEVTSSSSGNNNFNFNISISDCVILVGLLIAYAVVRIRKGR